MNFDNGIFPIFQATSGEDGNGESGTVNISIPSSPRSTDVADSNNMVPVNEDPNTSNITTKHVKQNSFDSGIADAAHSFSSSRGNNGITGVLSE